MPDAHGIADVRVPFGVRIDRAIRVREGVAAELSTHLADNRAAVIAGVGSVVDDFGIAKGEICHIVLRK